MSHCFALFIVWPVTEHEADNASLPRAFQHDVVDSFAVSAVIPLRQVTRRVSAGQWTMHLNVTNTSAAFKPSQNHKYSTYNYNSNWDHSRPFNRLHTSSYSSSVVTTALFCIVWHIKWHTGQKSSFCHTPSGFDSIIKADPSECHENVLYRKLEWLGYQKAKKVWGHVNPFDRIHERGGRPYA